MIVAMVDVDIVHVQETQIAHDSLICCHLQYMSNISVTYLQHDSRLCYMKTAAVLNNKQHSSYRIFV
jgi:hypothetical protein